MQSTKPRLMNLRVFEEKITESRLDAVVGIAGKSVVHLSGASLPGTLGRLQDFPHTPRMNIMVWPTGSSPTLIVTPLSQGVARRESWVEDLRPYEEYVESPMVALAKVIKDRDLAEARIGIEKRYIGATRWEDLCEMLPHAQFVECADLLESVRNIKTDAEVALLKRASDMMDEALLEVFSETRAGHTERQLHASIIGSLLRRGAQFAHGILRTSSNPVIYGGESSAPLKPGDIIQSDYVSYVDNYAANLSRVAVVGKPSAEQIKIYKDLLAIHQRTIANMLKPGVRAKDVFLFVGNELAAAGYPTARALIGHCLGVVWHQEEPIMSATEERELKAGMVVCLEPRVFDYHIQDEFVITNHGPKLLSDRFSTDEMFVMKPK